VAFPKPELRDFPDQGDFGGTYVREIAEKRSAKGFARVTCAILHGLIPIRVNTQLTLTRKLNDGTNVIFECFK
jgi:hypothetical protein